LSMTFCDLEGHFTINNQSLTKVANKPNRNPASVHSSGWRIPRFLAAIIVAWHWYNGSSFFLQTRRNKYKHAERIKTTQISVKCENNFSHWGEHQRFRSRRTRKHTFFIFRRNTLAFTYRPRTAEPTEAVTCIIPNITANSPARRQVNQVQ